MLRLSIAMLCGSTRDFVPILLGLVFATVLILHQVGTFCGVMTWTYAPIRLVQAPIWVTKPMVEKVDDYDPLRDIDEKRVKTAAGCLVCPVFSSLTYARMPDGRNQLIHLVGVEPSLLPAGSFSGRDSILESLSWPDSVLVDELGSTRLAAGAAPLTEGSQFEIYGHYTEVRAIIPAPRLFSGAPFVVTHLRNVPRYAPFSVHRATLLAVFPQPGRDHADVCAAIQKQTGLRAFTDAGFVESNIRWWLENTSVPGVFVITIGLGVFIAISLFALTFLGFLSRQRAHFAALMAMGCGQGKLFAMILTQIAVLVWLAFGIGAGIVSIYGFAVKNAGNPPFALYWQLLAGIAGVLLVVGGLISGLATLSLRKIEPASVFRAVT